MERHLPEGARLAVAQAAGDQVGGAVAEQQGTVRLRAVAKRLLAVLLSGGSRLVLGVRCVRVRVRVGCA